MKLGRGFTAVARQVPRLAGLVWIPVYCRVKTAIRQQASWLAKKASADLKLRWPFVLQEYSTRGEASQAALLVYG